MIVKNFSTGRNSVSHAVNYLLSQDDWKGNVREQKPDVLKGDPELTKQIGKELCDRFSSKYLSGVIALREGETLTQEQKLDLISSFEKTFMPEMEGKFNALYVSHGEHEIHYVVNKVDLETGKAFNPMPPGHEHMKDLFQKTENFKYGFEQVIPNPDIGITKYTHEEQKAIARNETFGNLKSKQAIDTELKSMVQQGLINNREELISFLKNDCGFTLSRIGQDYLSIKNPDGQNIRLKGGIYVEGNNKSYEDLAVEKTGNIERASQYSKTDYERDKRELTQICQARATYNLETYSRRNETSQIELSNNTSNRDNRYFADRLNDALLPEKSNSRFENRHNKQSEVFSSHQGATNKLNHQPRQKTLLHTNTGELSHDRIRNKLNETLGKSEQINGDFAKRSHELSKSSSELSEGSNDFKSNVGAITATCEKTIGDTRLFSSRSADIKKKLGELGMKSQQVGMSKFALMALDYKIAEMTGQLAQAEAHERAQAQRTSSYDFER
ncbi:relaxase/mobilization nuclease domain-containing protein [uncultured Ralstonia sp.]|uniref:relaxase/mobilization nuclease domain-containing protein n=1 Tax=uncultured Ralstonia sp. TaxID=114715 RepID=UPI0026219354|nr:relaxase/mobilization nuclease domain-containing protein [uncultured Ralstonia sp.]